MVPPIAEVKLTVHELNAFCRLRDLVYVEETRLNSELALRFIDFENNNRVFLIEEVKAHLRSMICETSPPS